MKRPIKFLMAEPQFAVLVVLILVVSFSFERFLSPMNLSAIGFQYALFGFLALGQFLVILTRGIDLSQGAILAVSSMAVAGAANVGGPASGLAAGLIVGALFGLMNGIIVSFTKIPPFVVTLGMMGIARGIALTITESAPVRLYEKGLATISWTKIGGLPVAGWTFLATALVIALLLHFHVLGRHLYAVGGHEEHARLSGVRSQAVKMIAYVTSGLLCGLAATFLTARLGTGHPLSGNAWELESIAAAIIGGAGLLGGSGKVLGIVCGVLILGVIDSVINLAGVSPYLQGTLKGGIILTAVVISARTVSAGHAREKGQSQGKAVSGIPQAQSGVPNK